MLWSFRVARRMVLEPPLSPQSVMTDRRADEPRSGSIGEDTDGAHDIASVDVIVPNWNGLAHLEKCIESILAQTYPRVRAVVVDNGSRDDSVAFIKRKFPQVHLIEVGYNSGF